MGVLDIAAAILLSVYAVGLVNHQHGGVGASVGVLAMTLPVAWRRRAPVAAAVVLAARPCSTGLSSAP